MIDAFLNVSDPSEYSAAFKIFCESYAVSPTNKPTVMSEISHEKPDERKNKLMSEAMMMPHSAIIK